MTASLPPADSDGMPSPLGAMPNIVGRQLADLLGSRSTRAGTRFGEYADHPAPIEQMKLALLLTLCGYEVRLHADSVDVRATAWVPALRPGDEPAWHYLRKQCCLVRPQRTMDPDDERLTLVFGGERGRRPEPPAP